MKVKFSDLFCRFGQGQFAYSDRAAALAGSPVEIRGWLVALRDEPGAYALVDRPGASADAAASVAAIRLPGFRAIASCESPVQLRGRLSYGFAVAANGFASFLKLEDARVAGSSGRSVLKA